MIRKASAAIFTTLVAMACGPDEARTRVEETTRAALTVEPTSFVDACLLPGHVDATFQPYGSIWEGDEGVTAPLVLPFSFTYFGVTHSRFWVTSNGELGFGSVPSGPAFGRVQCPLTDAQIAAPIIFAYATDLLSSRVCIATTGSAPHRNLVVTWKDARLYELDGAGYGTSDLRFGVSLSETTGEVDIAIDRVELSAPFWPSESIVLGAWATVGLQSGSAAKSFSCQSPHAPAGSRFHYRP